LPLQYSLRFYFSILATVIAIPAVIGRVIDARRHSKVIK